MHNNINVAVGGPINADYPKVYKTKFLKPGIPFSLQVTEPNTKYVIKHNFVLDGDVTIPDNCILRFEGGKLTNGTIIGQNTRLQGDILLGGVMLKGTYINVDIDDSWFIVSEYENTWSWFNMLIKLANNNQQIAIHIHNDYEFDTADYNETDHTIFNRYYTGTCWSLFQLSGSLRLYGDNNRLTVIYNGERMELSDKSHSKSLIFAGIEMPDRILEFKGIIFDGGFNVTDGTYMIGHFTLQKSQVVILRHNTGYYKSINIDNCDFVNGVSESLSGGSLSNFGHPGTAVFNNCNFTNVCGAGPNLNTYKCIIKSCTFKNVNESIEWIAEAGKSLSIEGCIFYNSRLPISIGHASGGSVWQDIDWSETSDVMCSIKDCHFEVTDEYSEAVRAWNGTTPLPFGINSVCNTKVTNCTFVNYKTSFTKRGNSRLDIELCYFEKTHISKELWYVRYTSCTFNKCNFLSGPGNQRIYDCIFIYDGDSLLFNQISGTFKSVGTLRIQAKVEGDITNSKLSMRLTSSDGSKDMYIFGKEFTEFPINTTIPIKLYCDGFNQNIIRGMSVNVTNTGTGAIHYTYTFRLTTVEDNLQGYSIPREDFFVPANDGNVSSGYPIYNNTKKMPLWYNASNQRFEQYDNVPSTVLRSGTFANKPSATDIYVGFKYFCIDKQTTEGAINGIEIIHTGNDVWVDALGRIVS